MVALICFQKVYGVIENGNSEYDIFINVIAYTVHNGYSDIGYSDILDIVIYWI